MLVRGLLLLMLFSTAPLAVGQTTPERALEAWPLRVLSFSYLIGQGWEFYEDPALSEWTKAPSEALQQEFADLIPLFKTVPDKQYPAVALSTTGRYCWIKWQPGFTCGDMKARASQDERFLYVSDPVEADRPFLLLIMVDVAPRRTTIYRLFKDELELVYDLFSQASDKCVQNDPDIGLFVTYNAGITPDGRLTLYETEGFHSDQLPVRQFELEITDTSCTITQTAEIIPAYGRDMRAQPE